MWRLFLNKTCVSGWLWLILGASPLVSLARAADPVTLELHIADLEREGVHAEGIAVSLSHFGDRQDVTLHVDRLEIPGLARPLKGIDFVCPDSRRPWPGLACEAGRLEVAKGPWGARQLDVDLDWAPASGLRLAFSGLRYAGDRLRGSFDWNEGHWRLAARARRLALAKSRELRALRQDAGLDTLAGRFSGRVELRGSGGQLQAVSLNAGFNGLAYADKAGEQAAEKLGGRIRISGLRGDSRWRGSVDLRLESGEVYSDPVFVDIARQPLHLTAEGFWKKPELRIDRLSLDGGRLLRVKADGRIDTAKQAISRGQARIDSDELGGLYRQVLQPLLVETRFDDLDIEGDAGLHPQWKRGALAAVDVAIDRLDLDHRDGSFGANGLQAQLFWRRKGKSPDSRIQIEGGHLGRINLGGLSARFNAAGRYAYLLAPVRIPFYQGEIRIPELSWVQTAQGPDVGFSTDIARVSLEALSTDLGWPRMRGRIALSCTASNSHVGLAPHARPHRQPDTAGPLPPGQPGGGRRPVGRCLRRSSVGAQSAIG